MEIRPDKNREKTHEVVKNANSDKSKYKEKPENNIEQAFSPKDNPSKEAAGTPGSGNCTCGCKDCTFPQATGKAAVAV